MGCHPEARHGLGNFPLHLASASHLLCIPRPLTGEQHVPVQKDKAAPRGWRQARGGRRRSCRPQAVTWLLCGPPARSGREKRKDQQIVVTETPSHRDLAYLDGPLTASCLGLKFRSVCLGESRGFKFSL